MFSFNTMPEIVRATFPIINFRYLHMIVEAFLCEKLIDFIACPLLVENPAPTLFTHFPFTFNFIRKNRMSRPPLQHCGS